ncbi:MAG: hypothetical protein AB4352_20965 [Hormoscilla sp.]
METVDRQNSKGLFAAWNSVSLKTQQMITAITAAVISSLAVVIVIQVEPKLGDTLGVKLMVALGTAIAVGAVTFALQQITINKFNRSRDNLLTVLKAVARDSENVKAEIGGGKEWEEVAIALGQMQEAIAIRVGEAEQKAAAAEKASEELQQQLIELVNKVDKDKSEITASNEEEQMLELPGTIVEFMEDFHQEPIPPAQIIGSSTIEEMKQHFDKLQYRRVWLEALLNEASRELELLKLHLHL